ncbi:tetratricopeptide repeat protein [Mucilaginibacter pedocola]|uniref:Uncharacterized protein n=1 Tax=Mucilaginibacter pedocola TaxID=1792845 RepID=A0A1S9PKH2_9SPHI|nr:tetratricopeptide repeat protein [Mucilaginibacter pedocola]OOQ61435.1 hypothetical protein BC343_20940 [Mucilaginibacter pedocola]
MRKHLTTYRVLLCFFLLCPFVTFGQTETTALLNKLNKARLQSNFKTDTASVILLNSLTEKYFYSSTDTAQLFVKEALALAKAQKFEKGVALSYNNTARVYYILGSYFPSLTAADDAMAVSQKIGYKTGIGAAYNNKGLIYLAQDRMHDAIYEFGKSLNYAQQLKDSAKLAANYFNIGLCYDEIKQVDKAFDYLKKGMVVAERTKNWHMYQMTLNRMGETYYHAKNYPQALKHYSQALNFKRYQDNWEKGFAYSGWGKLITNWADTTRPLIIPRRVWLFRLALMPAGMCNVPTIYWGKAMPPYTIIKMLTQTRCCRKSMPIVCSLHLKKLK